MTTACSKVGMANMWGDSFIVVAEILEQKINGDGVAF